MQKKKKRPKTDKDNFNGKINAWRIAMNHSLVKFKMEKKHTDTHFLLLTFMVKLLRVLNLQEGMIDFRTRLYKNYFTV